MRICGTRYRKRANGAIWFLVIILIAFAGHVRAAEYSVLNLGNLGVPPTQAFGINSSGEVTGVASPGFGTGPRAFLWNGSAMQNLGAFPGPISFGSYGTAVNSEGAVVGYATQASGYHAFLYNGGPLIDLGTLGGTYSYAYAINDSGWIVGHSNITGDTATHAFVYHDGAMTDLGTLGGPHSFAMGINSAGLIAGYSYTATGNYIHATLWKNGTIHDLGTLPGGLNSTAGGINDNGWITGGSETTSGVQHAFLYNGTSMIDIGTLGGQSGGASINDLGQIVGSSYVNATQGDAFIYSNGVMEDLNSLIPSNLGIHLDEAVGINDLGEIAASGEDSSGNLSAFLLTPQTPEPVLWPAVGALILLLKRGKRRSTAN